MKKRTLAILLTALLVVSVVFVLAACQKEYTVTFRDTSGRVLDTVTTVKGKATATDKATTKAGYTFEDWYKTIGQDDDGNYTYTDKVDLATYEFTEDTDLYAKWKRNITAGEEAGYCIIGKITGLSEEWTNGGFDPEAAMNEPKAQLTHATDPINLYSITLDVKALDSFKIKTNSTGWSNIEINGLSPLLDKGSVTLKSGVTLPEGVNKASDLFTYTYGIDNNVSPKCDMNITINFYYNASESYADLIVNSIDGELVKSPEEVGFIVVGDMTNWVESIAPDSANAKYILQTEDNNVFTATGIVVPRGNGFKIKGNENGWRTQFNVSALGGATVAEGVTNLPEGVTADDATAVFSGTDNIVARYPVTINVTLNYTEGKIYFEITEIDPTEQKPVTELGAVVVGGHNNWALVDNDYVMEYDEATQEFVREGVKMSLGNQFQVKINSAGWSQGQFGRGTLTTVTSTVDLPEGITDAIDLFDGSANDAKGNITTKRGMTITIKLVGYDETTLEGHIEIIITEIKELPDVTHEMFIVGTLGGGNFDQAYDDDAIKLTKKDNSTLWYGKVTITADDYGPDWTADQGGYGTVCAAIKVKNNVDNNFYGVNSGSGTAGNTNIFLIAGDYIVTYNEEGNIVCFEKMEYYVVGTFVDAEDNNVSFSIKADLTPKMTVSADGKTATVNLTVADVSQKDGYTWLGENVFAVQVVYGTTLNEGTEWIGVGNKQMSAVGEYTITLDIEGKTFEVAAVATDPDEGETTDPVTPPTDPDEGTTDADAE